MPARQPKETRIMPDFSLAFVANSTKAAQDAKAALSAAYDHTTPEDADIIVALGGDGFMLQTQLNYMDSGKPVYGMNKGTIGFLMNEFHEDGLIERIDKPRLEALVCDGVMVATPQGSTAYNLSAHGPILPLKAPLLALTPVSPFRPRNWRGALLPNTAQVKITALEPEKRPVNAVADNTEIKSAVEVTIHEDRQSTGVLMFDPKHSWEERILDEQFRY